MPANLENSVVATGLEKVSFFCCCCFCFLILFYFICRSVFIPIPKKGNDKKCSNYHTIALISHVSKLMLKILQARLQQYVNHGLPDVQAGFRKGRGIRDQIVNTEWIIEKTREFLKSIYFCFIDCAKLLIVWITRNCGKF